MDRNIIRMDRENKTFKSKDNPGLRNTKAEGGMESYIEKVIKNVI